MKVRFFDPGQTYRNNETELDIAIQNVLNRGDLILRDDVEVFEKNLAEFVGTKYAVGLNSGTDALYLVLKALGLQVGSKVLIPSHTFVATAQVAAQIGCIIELYDLDEELVITDDVKAVMVSHIAGELSLLPQTDLPVVEDACQALGAIKNPKTAAQCWSFYPAKILGAFGDAGALTTNDENIYNYVKEARNHFKTDYSQWGINSRLDNLQAAILNVKFKYLPKVLARRKEIAFKYNAGLASVVSVPYFGDDRVWQDYIIQVHEQTEFQSGTPYGGRNELYDFLKNRGVETMKNEYPMPIGKLPKAAQYEAETLRLPINEVLTDQEIEYVIHCIKDFYN